MVPDCLATGWNPRGKLAQSVHDQVQQQNAAALKEGGEAEW